MKRFFITALAVVSLTFSKNVIAQRGFSMTVKATPQFSFLQNEDDNKNSNINRKATFNTNFGIGAGYNFTPNVGLGVDVLYSLQGQRHEVRGVESNEKVNYLKVPLYLTYNTNANRPVSFIAKVGPQLSILTDAKLSNKDGDDIIGDTKERYENSTFGAVAGAGVQFKLSKNVFLNTSARFDYDFTDAEDKIYLSYPAGRAITSNMTAGLEVGLKFLLN